MKRVLVAAATALLAGGCVSVDSATVSGNEVVANGDAVAVIQVNAVGLSAVLHLVDFVQADLDTVVNRYLVSEAKAMGGSKVDIKEAETTPRHGIFALLTCPDILICPTYARAVGVAVK